MGEDDERQGLFLPDEIQIATGDAKHPAQGDGRRIAALGEHFERVVQVCDGVVIDGRLVRGVASRTLR